MLGERASQCKRQGDVVQHTPVLKFSSARPLSAISAFNQGGSAQRPAKVWTVLCGCGIHRGGRLLCRFSRMETQLADFLLQLYVASLLDCAIDRCGGWIGLMLL
jgi:hypothetical protein